MGTLIAAHAEKWQHGSASLLLWTEVETGLIGPKQPTDHIPKLSVVDKIAAPSAFMHQALLYGNTLNPLQLCSAIAQVQTLMPTLSCRASKDPEGEWVLTSPDTGVAFTLGTSLATLQTLVPTPTSTRSKYADIGFEVFSHLPNTLPDAADEAVNEPLMHVALVTLADAGCVLGLRLSHLVADFGTLRAVLHHMACVYSDKPLDQNPPTPAEPVVSALAAAELPPDSQPWNYLPWPSNTAEQFSAVLQKPALRCIRYHVPPARLKALKVQALADLQQLSQSASIRPNAARSKAEVAAALTAATSTAASTSAGNGAADAAGSTTAAAEYRGMEWVSTNDAFMAHLWKTLASLPCRAGVVTAFNMALDMRSRLEIPEGIAPLGHWVYGNLATSAFCPALDVAAMSLGEVALELRRTIGRDAAKFAPDIVHAARQAADGAGCRSQGILPVMRILEAVAAGKT
eukprot:GHRR01021347.1.p1 GENE.GHRR01021347.1~~GHRR01021347.1.p1  ORF type:complete len:459 (+),score=135.47 GHRR01021347.1:106-1482(+)